MSTNKTIENETDVGAFLASIENPTRKSDAAIVVELMQRVTGLPPKMWGASIIGFGSYHYKYDSGREGDSLRSGFSPRKANLAFYISAGFKEHPEILARLGKFKIGKSCLYVNKLADIDLAVLEELVAADVKVMAQKYPT